MPWSDSRQGMTARMETLYFDTTGTALQISVFLINGSASVNLTVGTVSEEGMESSWIVLNTLNVRNMLDAQTYQLPDGLHRVFVQGHRQLSGPSGIVISNVAVNPIAPIGTYACNSFIRVLISVW